MKCIPQFILVVACINSKKCKGASKILAQYLEGMPNIKYEGHGTFTDTTYYIFKNIAGLHNILYNICSDMCTCRFIGYATYEHSRIKQVGVTFYKQYSFSSTSNILSLPTRMGIADSDLDKFIAITRG